jgi:hypothetical protein
MLLVQYKYTYTSSYPRFQASATKQMRTTLFWEIRQRIVVIIYRRFGITNQPHLQGSYIYSYLKFGYNSKKNGSYVKENSSNLKNTNRLMQFNVISEF